MKKLKIIPVWFSLLLLLACSSVRVLDTQSADNFRLGSYQTFDFYQVEAQGDTLGENFQQGLQLLQQEIRRELTKRGLTPKEGEADLLVNLGIVVEEKVQTRETNILTDPPTYIGQRRYSWKSHPVEVGHYRQGTVSVHLVDRAKNELVWQGTAQGVVPAKKAKLQRTVQEGVQKLFSRLP